MRTRSHPEENSGATRPVTSVPHLAEQPAQSSRYEQFAKIQQAAGNSAVSRALLHPHEVVPALLQRQTQESAEPVPYVAHPAVLADCVSRLRQAYWAMTPAALAELRGRKTLAVGAVIDQDEPNVTIYRWTANGNWTNTYLSLSMNAQGVRRWDGDPARIPRGTKKAPGGAPGDAEQRMMSDDHVVKAIAVSRPPCPDCLVALAEYGRDFGRVLVQVVPPPTEDDQRERQAAKEAIRAAADSVLTQVDEHERSHQSQWDLIYRPSVSGFAGYWTNHLFNADIPPVLIWINPRSAGMAARRLLAQGDIRGAVTMLMRARIELAHAIRQYRGWTDGVESAGTQAKIAIAAVGLAAIAAVVAAPLLAEGAAASAGGAGSAETAAATTVRIVALVTRYDAAVAAMEAAATEAEISAAAAAEAAEFFEIIGVL